MIWIFSAIALVALVIGSYSDIRTREVPDWANFGLIFTGVGLHAILSVTSHSWQPLLSSGIGLGIGIGVAFAMYYLGQWGGGDAKMIMGLGALIGFDLSEMFFISFLINSFVLGAFYGLCYGAVLAFRKRKAFAAVFRKLYYATPLFLRRMIAVLLCLMAVSLLLARLLLNGILFIYIVSLFLALVALFYLFLFAKAIEKCCMLKYAKPSELTEGDWIAKEVRIKGRYVCGPKDLGIVKKQIERLKRAKVKRILIKEGIPFVPSFLISFVFTLYLGNVFFLFFTIL